MASLFKKRLLNEKIESYTFPDLEEKIAIIQSRHDAYKKGILTKKTESECEQAFNDDFFKKILGYTSFPSNPYTLDPKGKTDATGQKPDAILGYFDPEKENQHSHTQVVVEIKDANTPLDKSQRREGNLSPIQQGFKYKPQYTGCKRVIATNFIEIRLFKDNQLDYEIRTLEQLLDPSRDYYNFKTFYYLLNADHLIAKRGTSTTEHLLTEVRVEQEAISKAFYREYKSLRHQLINDLHARNPQISILTIVQKAQKIIDRLIFIHFCEDLGLLPQNKLKTNVEKAKEVGFTSWEMIKKFFHLVDTGSESLEIPDGYNGGLFKKDPLLDSLQMDDTLCHQFVELGKYDFSEDLSVNILGHIFEQSISDLEEIRAQLLEEKGSSKASEAKQSKRKKDGIFYTPEYIVDYIVKNSLGTRLEEQFESLKKQKFKQSKQMKDSTFDAKEKELYAEYQQILQNVKVLDPACGSGAFLVKVFDYLLEENVRVMNILAGGDAGLFESQKYEIAKSILTNNIYGVDLNQESVEITKLSLWLKTAQKGKKLADLDDNIKCGNSLIDDPDVAGEKAFNREQEFPTIFQPSKSNITPKKNVILSLSDRQAGKAKDLSDNRTTSHSGPSKTSHTGQQISHTEQIPRHSGQNEVADPESPTTGFDVIVGNPPYVRSEFLKQFSKFFEKTYDVYASGADLFAYFYEKGFNLLKKESGILGYISNAYDKTKAGKNLREWVQKHTKILKYIDFTEIQIFEGATTYPIILVGKKQSQKHGLFSYIKVSKDIQSSATDIQLNKSIHVNQNTIDSKSRSFVSKEADELLTKILQFSKIRKTYGKCYYGIKTGLNEAFIVPKNTFNGEHIKPIYEGKDIKKWHTPSSLKELIVFKSKWTRKKYGEEVSEKQALESLQNEYPSIFTHLLSFENKAKKRYDTGDYFWELRNCAYYELFEKPKIVFPNLQNKNKFCYDISKSYILAPAVFLPSGDKFLLSILNSKLIWFFLKNICVVRSGGYIEVKPQYFEQIPIPKTTEKKQQPFIEKADIMLSLNQQFHNLLSSTLDFLSQRFDLPKLSKKLQSFYLLDFPDFKKQLKIKKLSLTEEEELLARFTKKKNELLELKSQIDATDREIDEMVYKLYGLTKEEIAVVENS